MQFFNDLNTITADNLRGGFFEGWASPPSPEQHLALLHGSSHVVIALEGIDIVGFVNAISDGVLTAYIPLIEVLPSHRGDGIGSELMRRLLEQLDGLYMIDVMCDEDVFPFYEHFGFQRAGGGIIRNYEWRRTAAAGPAS